ncbi:DUF3422 domain-containing protein [Castellaniella defragrans]|uniref:Putative membrane-anchored protein n=1 Tax=Castellaniella defragrans TaxID=75697 RepID=A0A7W9TN39_CASDE|nr:DUF3422 domain-containing protein [Castellaniella defragrans]KAB0618744.1 DUF3422 domain-containing protein [Castellaniella defragrans]MBB6082457.1 putative membrane-anchored protein [Castellaniella defragrans]
MHPHRNALHNELHARPSMYFDAPAQVFHLAFLDEHEAAEAIVRSLCDRHVALADPSLPQGEFPVGGARLKWERHTEFLTLTLVLPGPQATPWVALPPVLAEVAEAHSALLVNADQVCVESEASWRGSVEDYGFKDPVGSSLDDGKAIVWSDLRLNGNGLNRILVLNRQFDGRRLGRMVRRLLEVETYRLMASLTLPVARALSAELRQYEQELAALSDANARAESQDIKALLERITRLSARITQTSARTRLRLSATEAYAQLVFERIAELHESRTGDCQQLGTFIAQRFRPTVRYCASTDQRLSRIGSAVSHLSSLLQARVQVEMEEQNSQILQSLSTRAETQIKIQKAVEGLSIIAISYYLFSLFKLLYQGMLTLGIELPPRTALLAGTPLAALIIGAIAYRIRNTRRH